MGESGSGKSTLLKMLLGLPLRGLTVTEGSITFEGQEIQPQDHFGLIFRAEMFQWF